MRHICLSSNHPRDMPASLVRSLRDGMLTPKTLDPHAHIPEGVRQALEDDLWAAVDQAADLEQINVHHIQHILGPQVGPQIAALWDLPALVENLALQFAPGRAEPQPQRPGRVELPLRPRLNPHIPEPVAALPHPDWDRHVFVVRGQDVRVAHSKHARVTPFGRNSTWAMLLD